MEITAAVPTATAATISVTRPETGREDKRVEPAKEPAGARFDDAGHREQNSVEDGIDAAIEKLEDGNAAPAPTGHDIGAELRIDDRTNSVYSSFVNRSTGEEISEFPAKTVRGNSADIRESLGRKLNESA